MKLILWQKIFWNSIFTNAKCYKKAKILSFGLKCNISKESMKKKLRSLLIRIGLQYQTCYLKKTLVNFPVILLSHTEFYGPWSSTISHFVSVRNHIFFLPRKLMVHTEEKLWFWQSMYYLHFLRFLRKSLLF